MQGRPHGSPPTMAGAGVFGWGFGLKEVGGRPTTILAHRAYVARKVALADLVPHHRIPAVIDGVPTDVVEYAAAQSARGRDGMPPGTRIVNARGVPGTLGCYAWTCEAAEPVLIGNWHTLFGEGARRGDGVYIMRDGDFRYARIGHIHRGQLGSVEFEGVAYHVDAAIAVCSDQVAPRRPRRSVAPPRRAGWARAGDAVHMRGAASGMTSGVVTDIAYPDLAMIEGRPIVAQRQILVRPMLDDVPFAATGDSGAILRDANERAIGLLWGSNGRGEGIACHILPVLAALDVTLRPSWAARWRQLRRRGRALISRRGKS